MYRTFHPLRHLQRARMPLGRPHVAQGNGIQDAVRILQYQPHEHIRIHFFGLHPDSHADRVIRQGNRLTDRERPESPHDLRQCAARKIISIPGMIVEVVGLDREHSERVAGIVRAQCAPVPERQRDGSYTGNGQVAVPKPVNAARNETGNVGHPHIRRHIVENALLVAPVKRASYCRRQHRKPRYHYEKQHEPAILQRVARHVPKAERHPHWRPVRKQHQAVEHQLQRHYRTKSQGRGIRQGPISWWVQVNQRGCKRNLRRRAIKP